MHNPAAGSILALLCLATSTAVSAVAAVAPPVPEGPAAPVATTFDFQAPPGLAFRPDGDVLLVTPSPFDPAVCGSSPGSCAEGPLAGYLLNRFVPSQNAPAVQLGATLPQPQLTQDIRIARGSGTRFLVVWEEASGSGSGSGIFAQLFADVGVEAGPAFRVNTTTAGDPTHPSVAALSDGAGGVGGYFVVWQSRPTGSAPWTVLGQRLDAQGNAIGGEIAISEADLPEAEEPSVASSGGAGGGSFLVAFRSAPLGASSTARLLVRPFAADGTPLGPSRQIDAPGDGDPHEPALAARTEDDRGYAAAWRGDLTDLSADIWVRRLDALGNPSAAAVRADIRPVPAPAPGDAPMRPEIAADGAGGFLAVWSSPNAEAGSPAVLATYFGPPADEPAREIVVSPPGLFSLLSHRVVSDGDHAYAVVWSYELGLNGSVLRHYSARRFTVPGGTCTAGPQTLCLGGGRFRVETFWNDPYAAATGIDRSGHGSTLPLSPPSETTGLFWFFDPGNVELIVKVLDGRTLDQSFWFFYGALSDVEYWIRATDTVTGTLADYHNPPYRICGAGDTLAFPQPATIPTVLAPAARTTALPGSPVLATSGSCIPDAQTLCLLNGRFAARVQWKNQHAGGGSGLGQAIPGTDATGYFWFFDPTNVELVVKVLDGRSLTGKFWVFYGALSDVEYTLTVTDTETGAAKRYHNAPGNLCGLGDTSAF